MPTYAIVEIKKDTPSEAISTSTREIAIKRFRKIHPSATLLQICPVSGCTFDHLEEK
jgi:hypothetical protein